MAETKEKYNFNVKTNMKFGNERFNINTSFVNLVTTIFTPHELWLFAHQL